MKKRNGKELWIHMHEIIKRNKLHFVTENLIFPGEKSWVTAGIVCTNKQKSLFYVFQSLT